MFYIFFFLAFSSISFASAVDTDLSGAMDTVEYMGIAVIDFVVVYFLFSMLFKLLDWRTWTPDK